MFKQPSLEKSEGTFRHESHFNLGFSDSKERDFSPKVKFRNSTLKPPKELDDL